MDKAAADARRAKFDALLPDIRHAAWEQGYAIGVHGTLARDFDLIAAPWIDTAASPAALAEAIRQVTLGRVHQHEGHAKPHGRECWLIYPPFADVEDHHWVGYIDLSVMPRV